MKDQNIKKFLCSKDITLSQAMKSIDENSSRILFITEGDGKLIGCITDGDVRRFLLAGGSMTDMALKAANLSPKVAGNLDEARILYHKKNFVAIPIISEEGTVVDVYNGDGDEVIEHDSLRIPVVINAGGRGTRLEPFTKVLPKPLIPVGDLPIIEHIIREYQTYSCDEFHIIVNYKRDLMKAYFADNENHYNISWYDEDEPLGTGGGLSLLKGKINETFFFANCDVLLKANYGKILDFHRENGNAITMICAYKNITIPYGVVEIGVDGIIKDMKEKPLVSFLTNTGVYIVEPEVVDDVEDGVSVGFPDIIEKERKKGRKVAVYPVGENDWMDMGQLKELEKMRKRLYGE